MHGFAAALVMGILFGPAPGLALAQPNDIPAVTIRLYDYVRLTAESIEAAQRQVTDLYGAIRVHVVWADTVQPTAPRARDRKRDSRELVVNILTPAMSSRIAVGDEALGLAAVTQQDGGGMVAYVFFDRICQLAMVSAREPADVLGVIIAHGDRTSPPASRVALTEWADAAQLECARLQSHQPPAPSFHARASRQHPGVAQSPSTACLEWRRDGRPGRRCGIPTERLARGLSENPTVNRRLSCTSSPWPQ